VLVLFREWGRVVGLVWFGLMWHGGAALAGAVFRLSGVNAQKCVERAGVRRFQQGFLA